MLGHGYLVWFWDLSIRVWLLFDNKVYMDVDGWWAKCGRQCDDMGLNKLDLVGPRVLLPIIINAAYSLSVLCLLIS
jgi:hypothetical protein